MNHLQTIGHLKCIARRCIKAKVEAKRGIRSIRSNPLEPPPPPPPPPLCLRRGLQAVDFIYKMCIHFGAVKVVHSKSSDKHESSLTLRVALNKSWHRLISDTLAVRTLPTVSV